MIARFNGSTALLLIDLQQGVDALAHWGGPTARRCNPQAEANLAALLSGFRAARLPVAWTLHDSREVDSPLKLSEPGGRLKPGFAPAAQDIVVAKDVNGAFIGTNLEIRLRRAGIHRLVVAGFFTNMCVETSVRHAGNLGFDVLLAHDACATTNRVGPDGRDHDPELVHALSVASMHGEFCTAIATADALDLLHADAPHLTRVQGNEDAPDLKTARWRRAA